MKSFGLKYAVNSGLLLGGAVMLLSGLLIQAEYHMEGHGHIDIYKIVWGLPYPQWSDIHAFSSIFVALLTAWHVAQHWAWYKTVVRKKLWGRNRQVLTLTAIFVVVAFTGFVPWGIKICNGDGAIRKTFIEIHDKLALVLCIYLILHVVKRFRWYLPRQ